MIPIKGMYCKRIFPDGCHHFTDRGSLNKLSMIEGRSRAKTEAVMEKADLNEATFSRFFSVCDCSGSMEI